MIKKLATAALAAMMLLAAGCSTPKDVAYFQNDAEVVAIAKQQPIRIMPGDKIAILVKARDAAVSELFNLNIYSTRTNASSGTGITNANTKLEYHPGSNEGVASYTVTPEGTIDFPVLGVLDVKGMSRAELAGYIKGELAGRDLVKDPKVTVEFINTGVNIIGEVLKPGRYDLNVDEITILEALALAGDLTINGQRTNVRVLREENGQVKVYKLDLTDLDKTASSPAYYLQQNDVVYVEPNAMRKRQTTVNGNNTLSASFWISVTSLLTSVVTTLGVFIKK